MPGPPPSQKLLDAVEEIRNGATPSELEKIGYPHALAYRAARFVRFQSSYAPPSPAPERKAAPPKRIEMDYTSPKKGDRLLLPGVVAVVGGGVADYATVTPTVQRWRYPEFLAKARMIAKKEWGWPVEQYTETDFIDSCLYILFLERGYPLDAYYKIEDKNELLRILHADVETGEIKPIGKEIGGDGDNSGSIGGATDSGSKPEAAGGGANLGSGESPKEEGEPGGS